jgi:hypothetical protein
MNGGKELNKTDLRIGENERANLNLAIDPCAIDRHLAAKKLRMCRLDERACEG